MRDEKKKFWKKEFHSSLLLVLIPAELIWTKSIELRGEFFDIQKSPHTLKSLFSLSPLDFVSVLSLQRVNFKPSVEYMFSPGSLKFLIQDQVLHD